MKTLDEMTEKELKALDILARNLAQGIVLSQKSPEEFIKVAVDYWAEISLSDPLSALVLELIERLEDAYNINQEPDDE